eukprot:TRINITY_DN1480_c0_g1_i1.p1 TRINITY_DN1480_c0_g1~~TRINITY_DN1480_c0_g1_i1.p1  ORF type:complete len:338 (+),score=90.76 TRINITY_DN1480_c0_g1_i1:75-1016(+)
MGPVHSVLPTQLAATVAEGQSVLCGVAPDGESELRVALVGASGAGKTTLCLRLLGRNDERPLRTGVEPYMLPNMMCRERMNLWTHVLDSGIELLLIDCGGAADCRPLWTKHWAGVAGMVFVVDGSDPSSLPEARTVMQRHVLPHTAAAQIPLIVIASDRPAVEPLSKGLLLSQLGLPWETQPPPPGSAPPPAAFAGALVAAVVAAAAAVAARSRRRTGVRMKWLTVPPEPPLDGVPAPPERRLLFARCPSYPADPGRETQEVWAQVDRLLRLVARNNAELSADPGGAAVALAYDPTLAPGVQFAAELARRGRS